MPNSGVPGGSPRDAGFGPSLVHDPPKVPGFTHIATTYRCTTHRSGRIDNRIATAVKQAVAKRDGSTWNPTGLYTPANTTPEAEFGSFKLQLERAAHIRARLVEPSLSEEDYVLSLAEDAFGAVRWKLADDWDSEKSFRQVLMRLDKSSSPGIPYLREAPTTGQWLKWELDRPDEVQAQRLWYDVRRVFAGTYDHHFRVFVKDEPHKNAKAAEGRWRLIIASSLPVQVAWQMCFRTMNDLLVDRVYQTPSMQGVVLCSGGWRRFVSHVRSLNLGVAKDLSGWDVNSPGWVFKLDLKLRHRLCLNPTSDWLALATRLYEDG